MRWFVKGILATVAVLALAGPAEAQTEFGVRAGFSAEPEQFHFGGHLETRPLIERLTFRPNAEIGVGDDLTVFTANLEFVYSVPLSGEPWRIYFGAGPALVVFSHDDGPGPGDGHDGAGGGFNILVGAQHSGGLFGEIKVGFADSPELKVTVGYAFR
jgi:hypothetical protein